jgi:hypothetical protein
VGVGVALGDVVVVGVGTGSAEAVAAVVATTAASTTDPAVTRIPLTQRTTHVFLWRPTAPQGTRLEPLQHEPPATIGGLGPQGHPG